MVHKKKPSNQSELDHMNIDLFLRLSMEASLWLNRNQWDKLSRNNNR